MKERTKHYLSNLGRTCGEIYLVRERILREPHPSITWYYLWDCDGWFRYHDRNMWINASKVELTLDEMEVFKHNVLDII